MLFIFRNILLLLILVNSTYSSENEPILDYYSDREVTEDYILCRHCGGAISSSNYLISKLSTAAQESFNDTLFNTKQVLIQVLASDFFNFPVVTTAYSTCVSVGEWQEHDSWYPGCRWKPCVCPHCGAYIGLVFEPINNNLVTPFPLFYGLILTNIIGETCNYKFCNIVCGKP